MILKSLSRILRDPSPTDATGGSATVVPAASATTSNAASDQAKITAALAKEVVSDTAPSGRPQGKVKPVTGRAPSEKALAMDFSVDDGDATLIEGERGTRLDETKPLEIRPLDDKTPGAKDVVKPVVETTTTKPADKVVEKVEPVVVKGDGLIRPKGSTATATTVATTPEKRDYSKFNADETRALKQMSNDSFALASKTLLDYKALQAERSQGYLQHPQAYTLTPEYNQINNQAMTAEFEQQHYQAQQLKIRAGDKWTVITGYDKQGQPIYSEPQNPTAENEQKVDNAVIRMSTMAEQFGTQRNSIVQNFQQAVARDTQLIEQERAKRFAWAADPKGLEDKVVLGNGKEQTVKDIISGFEQLFPSYHRANPLMKVAADLFVAVQIMGAENRELQGKANSNTALVEDENAGEINLEGADSNGKNGKGELVFSVEDMP